MAQRDNVLRTSRREFGGSAIAVAAVGAAWPLTTLKAQNLPSTLDEITSLCAKAVNTIIVPTFKASNALSVEQHNILTSIRWEVQPDNWNLFATRAVNSGGRSVIISAGMADLLYTTAYDEVLSHAMGMDQEFGRFISKVPDEARLNQRLMAQGRSPRPTTRFFNYAQLTMPMIRARIPSPAVFNEVIPLTVSGLAFTCGHELGHHVFHDVDPGSDQISDAQIRTQEARADRFSLNLCIRAGLNPLGAALLFLVYTAFGADIDHPAPECRLYDILVNGVAALRDDKGFIADLPGNPGKLEKFQEFRRQVARLRSSLPSSCN